MEILSLIISIFSLTLSLTSIYLSYIENKPKIKFVDTHISEWNKHKLILYSRLRNTGNKDITIEAIKIEWLNCLDRVKLMNIHFLDDPIILQKYSIYKLEEIMSENNQKYLKFKKARIVLDTTFGNIKKNVSVNKIYKSERFSLN